MSDQAMTGWYQWVGSHKVLLVEGFPVRLSVLENLLTVLDNDTHCPSLQSIEIINDLQRERSLPSLSLDRVHSWLEETVSLFLTQCSHLKSISLYTMYDKHNDQSNYHINHLVEVESRLLSLLLREIKKNTLVKVDITFHSPSSPFYQQICNFLTHHLSTLRDLNLIVAASTRQTVYFDEIMTFLITTSCPLRRLSLACESLAIHGSVMDYLQVAGMYLEELELGNDSQVCNNLVVSDELLGSIGRACPRLRTLHLFTSMRQNMKKPSNLYTLCPYLKSFVIECMMDYSYFSVCMKVDDERHVVQYYDNCSSTMEEMADWCHSLYTVLDRMHYYTLVITGYCFDFSSSECVKWQSVKSKLSLYICEIQAVMSETVLIEAVRDLPRLEKLEIEVSRHLFSDASLAAITEYRSNLKVLSIHDYPGKPHCHFSDEMIGKMIRTCKGLESLKLLGAGHESILAVRNHLTVRIVCLENVKVEKAMMITLLFDPFEGKNWTLRRGEVKGDDYHFIYKSQTKSWTSMGYEQGL
eukprot:scaffold7232_cov310-Ochromonas_danica.AAC.5